jgi:preprotein translocase subunit SecD
MNKSLLWRGVLILTVVAISALVALPFRESIKLGLDLEGGMHLVLRVETEDALRAERDKVIERLAQEAQEEGLSGLAPRPIDDTSFAVALPAAAGAREKIEVIAQRDFAEWELVEQDGRLVVRLPEQERQRLADLAVRQAQQTIENRVNAFGVAEPIIQRQGLSGDRIVVQLPGVEDPERVKELLKETAFLEFRIVEYPQRGAATSRDEILANYGGALPANLEILEEDIEDEVTGEVVGTTYYAVEKTARVTGRDLKLARPGLGQFNDPIVEFGLTHDGGQRFGEITGANQGKGLAIVLDGRIVSAPTIEDRITDQGIIRGQFTQQEVEDLSIKLRSGALPAGMVILEERTVGPSLGQESIDQGLRAGIVGSILVVVFMLVVYHVSGINAVVALSLNILMVFAGLAYFDATLTLPGIAGIVLTIGMAVDANVLIFERIREELRHGRTVRAAIDEGFSKALSSIVDGNLTTLIAALFLIQFGTGPVRGFAVTLSIGIIASLFTAVLVSRWLFDLVLARPGRVERLSIG